MHRKAHQTFEPTEAKGKILCVRMDGSMQMLRQQNRSRIKTKKIVLPHASLAPFEGEIIIQWAQQKTEGNLIKMHSADECGS